MTKILLILTLFLISVALQNVYAESFDFEYPTGEIFQINYELRDAKLTKLTIDHGTISFIVNSTDGKLFISFPKSIPLDYQEGLDYPVFVASLDGIDRFASLDKNTKLSQSANNCTFDVEIDFDNEMEKSIQININHGIFADDVGLTYVDLPEYCLEDDPRNDAKIQRQLNEKQCSNVSHDKGFNNRDEVVCIFPDSYTWLYERGYLKTYPIIE